MARVSRVNVDHKLSYDNFYILGLFSGKHPFKNSLRSIYNVVTTDYVPYYNHINNIK